MESYGGRKSSMVNSNENEWGTESFMASNPEKNACIICSSSGTCRYHSAEPNKQVLSVYSSLCDVRKKEQQLRIEEHQVGTTSKPVNDKQELQSPLQDTTQEQSIHGSSVCYGGPEEYYESINARKKETDMIKNEVRKLEEAADPSNLEYTTRGNWWKGSLDY